MFRIRFYVEPSSVLPKPLLGTVVFRTRARSRSMEGASEAEAPPVAVAAPLSKSADTVEHSNTPVVPHSETDATVFFSGNPEIDIIKGA